MNSRNFISDKAAREIESELREAFASEEIIEKEKFRLVRGELELYEPKDLHGALPYILIGFLQFGVSDIEDEVHLGYVLQFLNIRNYPWERPHDRFFGKQNEAAVSRFSIKEARAIRLWLEAVHGSGVFRLDSSAGEYLGYALAYWRDRERPDWVYERPDPVREVINDIERQGISDMIDAGNAIIVGARSEGFGGCQTEVASIEKFTEFCVDRDDDAPHRPKAGLSHLDLILKAANAFVLPPPEIVPRIPRPEDPQLPSDSIIVMGPPKLTKQQARDSRGQTLNIHISTLARSND